MLFMAQPTTLTIHIEAPVAKVFMFWADPGNWKQVARAEYTFEDIVVTPEGVGTTYREVEKVAPGVRWEYRGRFTGFVVNERIVEEYEGHLAGTFVYLFDAQGSGTQFTLQHLPAAIGKVPVVGSIMEGQMAHKCQRLLTDLKAIMEA
jgi:Activator of Hsp90 ATPase homolog 1-like protein